MAKIEKIGNIQVIDNKEDMFFYFPMISMACTGSGQAGTAPEFGGQLHGVGVGDRLPSVAVQYAYFWEDHF